MQEVPEHPQGQECGASLGSGAGGSREGGKLSQTWGSPTVRIQESQRVTRLCFLMALWPAAALGLTGSLNPPLCPSGCCALQRGWGCGVSAQSSAAPCGGQRCGASPAWAARLGCAGLGEGRGGGESWGGAWLGWKGPGKELSAELRCVSVQGRDRQHSQCRARRHGEESNASEVQKKGASPGPCCQDTPGKLPQEAVPDQSHTLAISIAGRTPQL